MQHTEQIGTTIYKYDNAGRVREWSIFVECDDANQTAGYYTVSGLEGGQLVTSGTTATYPKNVGRSNATTALEQARSEARSAMTKKIEEGYAQKELLDAPGPFQCMLAHDWTKRKDKVKGQTLFSQPKLDGIRGITMADGHWSRNNKPITSMDHIFDVLAPIFAQRQDLILDGEFYNHSLKNDFNTLVSLVRKQKLNETEKEQVKVMEYHVYDVPSIDGPFERRILWAVDHLTGIPGVKVVPTTRVKDDEHLDQLYAEYLADGYEGQMVRLNQPYENKRSNALLKRKEFMSDEFPVVSVSEGNGNWSGFIKRFTIRLPNGQTCDATPRGSQGNLIASGFKTPDWCTVRYFGVTPDGMLRFPIVTDWGFGKRSD